MEYCVSGTRGGKKGSGQLVVGSDVFDLLDHIHQPPHHWRDSSVTQNPAEREGKCEMRTKTSGTDTERERETKRETPRGKEENRFQCYITCSHLVAISSTVSLYSDLVVLCCGYLQKKYTWYLSR